MSGQSKKASLAETVLGTTIGFVIAMIANYYVLRVWNYKPTMVESFWMTWFFTAISLVRSYCVRRFFNWLHVKNYLR